MTETAAHIFWSALGAYAAAGVAMALVLQGWLLKRLDPAAATAPLYVRALLVPGMVAVWPALALRLAGVKAREDRA